MTVAKRTLEEQRIEFANGKFLATPLAGLMVWAIIGSVGIFHTMTRTTTIVALWYLLSEYRFIAIPFGIVLIYIITLLILKNRKKFE